MPCRHYQNSRSEVPALRHIGNLPSEIWCDARCHDAGDDEDAAPPARFESPILRALAALSPLAFAFCHDEAVTGCASFCSKRPPCPFRPAPPFSISAFPVHLLRVSLARMSPIHQVYIFAFAMLFMPLPHATVSRYRVLPICTVCLPRVETPLPHPSPAPAQNSLPLRSSTSVSPSAPFFCSEMSR